MLRKSAGDGFDLPGATLGDLCRGLSAYVDREIVDATGISGAFDIHLDLLPPDPSSPFAAGDAGPIAAAVKKLGLRLRSGKRPAKFLVIDHVERPSEN